MIDYFVPEIIHVVLYQQYAKTNYQNSYAQFLQNQGINVLKYRYITSTPAYSPHSSPHCYTFKSDRDLTWFLMKI